jgi:thiosulfate/3-mercaptopyruvate sulfurtransferase
MTGSNSHPLLNFSTQVVQADEIVASGHTDRLFIDVRLGEPSDELASFRTCHIFGAMHAQIREVFAGQQTPTSGNLPLPSVEALADRLHDWGVARNTEIVVYGPTPAIAARGWWVLKWAGAPNVRILDGGLNAWIISGGSVAQGDATPRTPRSIPLKLSAGNMPTIEMSEVERLDPSTILIDARDEPSYLAGHIASARNLPASDQWNPSRRLRSARAIAETYSRAGISPGRAAVAYCGGGVLSALEVLTMAATTGVVPRLYVGSWSEWSKGFEWAERNQSSSRRA